MWGKDTKERKESIGNSSVSSSVGEILYSLAVAYPAATPFPIGMSLMQATLSPLEAADLLFYLMNVMSTVSASTTTPSTRTTSSFIEEGWILDMAAEELEERYEKATSKEKQRKSGTRNNTKQNRNA
jgi:hypothetical protein